MTLADCLKSLHAKTRGEFHLPDEVHDRLTRNEELKFNRLVASGIPERKARREAGVFAVQKFLDTTLADLASVTSEIEARSKAIAEPQPEPTTPIETAPPASEPAAELQNPPAEPAVDSAPSPRRLAIERLESAETELADDPVEVAPTVVPAKKSFRYKIPEAQGGKDIIDDFLANIGPIQHPGEAYRAQQRREGKTRFQKTSLGGEWDGWKDLPKALQQLIFKRGSSINPDGAAQQAFDGTHVGDDAEGNPINHQLISDAKSDVLLDAIKTAWAARVRNAKQQKALAKEGKDAEKTAKKQDADFSKDSSSQVAGDVPIAVSDLKKDDVIEVAGQKLAVIHVDEDGNVTLEDHTRYGIQTVQDGDIIYGELSEPSERDFADINMEIDVAVDAAKLSSEEATDAYIARHKLEEAAEAELSTGGAGKTESGGAVVPGGQESANDAPAPAARPSAKVETPLEKTRRIVETQEANLKTAREEGDYELAASLSRVLPKLRRDLAEAERKASEATPESATPPVDAEPVEIWQRTRDSVGTMLAKHREAVKDAVARKKPVPDDVLAEYNGSAWADKEISKRNKAAKQTTAEPAEKATVDSAPESEVPSAKGSSPLDRAKISAMSDDQLASRLGALRIFMQEKMESGDAVDPNAVENVARLYSEARKRDLVDVEPTIDAYIDKESGSPSLPKLREGKASDDLLTADTTNTGKTANVTNEADGTLVRMGGQVVAKLSQKGGTFTAELNDAGQALTPEQREEINKAAKDYSKTWQAAKIREGQRKSLAGGEVRSQADMLDASQSEDPLFQQPAKPDNVESFLEKAIKDLETKSGQMFADPLFIQSVGKPALRAALKIVLAAYKGGKLAADAIAEGMAYLRANVANLDEKKAQEFFERYYEPEESAPSPEAATPEPPPVTPSEAEAALPPMPETTAAYNEETDKLLAAGGFEPIAKPARKALGTSWDEAQQQVAADTDKGSRLVEELNANPRTLVDDVESGVLLHELATRKAEQVKAQEALFAAVESGDADSITDAKARLEKARTRTFEAITAAKLTGTAWGRAGRFRQVHLDQDFSLVAMEAAWRSEVNGGKPLTPDQSKLIAELHKKIAESEAKVAAFEAKEAEAEAKRVFDEAIREAKKEAATAKKNGNRVATFLHEQAAKARARIIARRGKLFSTIDPLNIAGLVDEAIIGADHIANGLKELKAWSAAMIKDFGERLRPALPALFEKSKEYHQTIETEIAAKTTPNGKKTQSAPAAPETPESLLASAKPGAPLDPKLVFDLARAHVRAGVVGMEAVMKAVHADLAPMHEGLTEREVRDAFSGYGKVTFPSREEDLTALREYKTLARLTSQLEDAQKRVAPLKTGPQRDKATQAVRDLTKQVKETMRRLGIETTTPEQQLKTSLDAVKARLQNQIEDLNKQIATKKKPEGKTPIPYDDEAKALRAERDRLSALADEIFGKPEMTDAQRITAATKALDRSIAEEDALLKSGILKRPAKESKTPLTPELEAKRAMLDSMRDLRREMADAENPKKSPEDRAMEAAFKAAQASLARYDEMLKSGNLKPAERAAKFTPSTELETIWNERNAVRDAVAELRRSQAKRTPPEEMARKAALKALDKRMEELDRRIKDGDFSDRPVTPGKASQFDDVQDKRAEVKAMNELYRTLKKAQLPQRTPEEIQLARDKKLIAKRTEELKRRVAEGDYAPRVKKDPVMDAEKTKLLFENAKAKADYNRGLFEEQLKNRSLRKKIFDTGREVLNTSRAILTSFDVSAVFRQGGFIVFAHPVRGAASLGPMFKAFASEKAAFKVSNDIANRPNAPLYAKSKLFLAESDSTSLTKQEENFMGRWAAKIPGVAGSQRAYTTFLNKLRADSFDAMLDTMGNGAATTPEEAAAIANFINVATGRGNIPGKAAQAAAGLNSIFFAPRYVLSRFQLLAGQPFYGGNAKTRALIAKEYGRYLIGVGIVYALAMAAMDDDDEPIETDPTSSNFLKARFGNTRLDPMSGLLQATVFAAREGEALRRFATGDASKDPKYGSGSDVLGRFLRSKLSPAVGSAVDMLAGKDVTGRRVTPEDSLKRMVTPLSVGDIAKTMEEQGVAKGTVMSLLSLLGMGVQTYEAKK